MKRLIIIFCFIIVSICNNVNAQGIVGVKTNLLYGGLTFTPNIGVEVGLGNQTTLDISAGYNLWNVDGSSTSNKKLAHFLIQPEFRYFLCERFNGHFFGVHVLYSTYNISGYELPMLFGKDSKKSRFQGDAYGCGISYGYQLMLSTHWNLEFQAGLGYIYLDSNKYDWSKCGETESSFSKNYFGPTKLREV